MSKKLQQRTQFRARSFPDSQPAGTSAATLLQEAEVRNALRLKLFRKEINAATLAASLAAFDDDIREERFARTDQSTVGLYRRAESLSHQHSLTTGARILDILHVAAAIEMNAPCFISFDHRQRDVAKKSGLKVMPRII